MRKLRIGDRVQATHMEQVPEGSLSGSTFRVRFDPVIVAGTVIGCDGYTCDVKWDGKEAEYGIPVEEFEYEWSRL